MEETPPEGSNSKKKAKSKAKVQKATPASQYAGSQFKKLFMQPLNKMKPPKFLLPRFSQLSTVSSGNSSMGNEDSGQSQVSVMLSYLYQSLFFFFYICSSQLCGHCVHARPLKEFHFEWYNSWLYRITFSSCLKLRLFILLKKYFSCSC